MKYELHKCYVNGLLMTSTALPNYRNEAKSAKNYILKRHILLRTPLIITHSSWTLSVEPIEP